MIDIDIPGFCPHCAPISNGRSSMRFIVLGLRKR